MFGRERQLTHTLALLPRLFLRRNSPFFCPLRRRFLLRQLRRTFLRLRWCHFPVGSFLRFLRGFLFGGHSRSLAPERRCAKRGAAVCSRDIWRYFSTQEVWRRAFPRAHLVA